MGKNFDATTSPQSKHLKQFKWYTVPNTRTKAPCIVFPHAEQGDCEILVDVAEDVDVMGPALFGELELEDAECPEEYETTLSRRLNSTFLSVYETRLYGVEPLGVVGRLRERKAGDGGGREAGIPFES